MISQERLKKEDNLPAGKMTASTGSVRPLPLIPKPSLKNKKYYSLKLSQLTRTNNPDHFILSSFNPNQTTAHRVVKAAPET